MSRRQTAVAVVGLVAAVAVAAVTGAGVGVGAGAGGDRGSAAVDDSRVAGDRTVGEGIGPSADGGATDRVRTTDESEPNASVRIDDRTWEPPSGLAEKPVVVDSASLPEGGFVVLHDESLLDGARVGSVVGNSEYLPPGDHEDVPVTVHGEIRPGLRPVIVVAMVHRDTDDDREFDFVASDGGVDGPYRTDGRPVADSATLSHGDPPDRPTTTGDTDEIQTSTAGVDDPRRRSPTGTPETPESDASPGDPSSSTPADAADGSPPADGSTGASTPGSGSRTDGGIGPGFGVGTTLAVLVVLVAVLPAGRRLRNG